MTKFFRDSNNKYIGGFDGATPPAGAIEVPFPPEHALDTWDGTQWIAHTPTPEEAERARIVALPDVTPVTMKELRGLRLVN